MNIFFTAVTTIVTLAASVFIISRFSPLFSAPLAEVGRIKRFRLASILSIISLLTPVCALIFSVLLEPKTEINQDVILLAAGHQSPGSIFTKDCVDTGEKSVLDLGQTVFGVVKNNISSSKTLTEEQIISGLGQLKLRWHLNKTNIQNVKNTTKWGELSTSINDIRRIELALLESVAVGYSPKSLTIELPSVDRARASLLHVASIARGAGVKTCIIESVERTTARLVLRSVRDAMLDDEKKINFLILTEGGSEEDHDKISMFIEIKKQTGETIWQKGMVREFQGGQRRANLLSLTVGETIAERIIKLERAGGNLELHIARSGQPSLIAPLSTRLRVRNLARVRSINKGFKSSLSHWNKHIRNASSTTPLDRQLRRLGVARIHLDSPSKAVAGIISIKEEADIFVVASNEDIFERLSDTLPAVIKMVPAAKNGDYRYVTVKSQFSLSLHQLRVPGVASPESEKLAVFMNSAELLGASPRVTAVLDGPTGEPPMVISVVGELKGERWGALIVPPGLRKEHNVVLPSDGANHFVYAAGTVMEASILTSFVSGDSGVLLKAKNSDMVDGQVGILARSRERVTNLNQDIMKAVLLLATILTLALAALGRLTAVGWRRASKY